MLNFRAVLTGFLADLGSTFLFSAALVIVLLDPGSGSMNLASRLDGTIWIDAISLVIGLSLTAIGGFVAARMAPGREATHAAAVGVLSLLASIMMVGDLQGAPAWYATLGLGLTFPAALFGGTIAALTRLTER
ncbi:MAG: hypothetical protein KC910_07655 [Candidatus Eremiobacteraeota bacterium]|nr:hypothetical protein [Candidatus Eremiobacteraeota bacterium]